MTQEPRHVDGEGVGEKLRGVHLITERAEALRQEIWWDETFQIGMTTFHERIRPDEMSGRAIARHVLDAAGFAGLYDALGDLLCSVEAGPAEERYPGDREDRLQLACGAARAALASARGEQP